jgi:hypothetical protein
LKKKKSSFFLPSNDIDRVNVRRFLTRLFNEKKESLLFAAFDDCHNERKPQVNRTSTAYIGRRRRRRRRKNERSQSLSLTIYTILYFRFKCKRKVVNLNGMYS